jgi:lipopolysaccharide export system protein LptA
MRGIATLCAIVLAAAVLAVALPRHDARAQQQSLANHDTSQPIEITADSLEVRREEGLAVFTGNVDAVQGSMRLRADKLTVHYRPEGKTGGAMAQGAISQMDAEGSVFLSSPAETAQGERGVYNVDDRMVTMTGAVVLTRGENVVRGDRVVLNLVTGVSRVESAGTTSKGQRVKGLFVPQKKN